MTQLIEAVKDYPGYAAGLLVACVLCVLMWRKALRASKKRRERIEKDTAELKREKYLRDRYAVVTRELIEASEAPEAVAGICAGIQRRIERAENLNAAFLALPEPLQYVYALYYFAEDTRENLWDFFRSNGEPLTPLCVPALEAVGDGETARIAAEQYAMFDENNEEVTLEREEARRLNGAFSRAFSAEGLYALTKSYILANIAVFENFSKNP